MLFYSPLDNGRNGMYSKRKVALIVFFTFLATTVLCTASYTLVPAVGSALGDVRSVLTGSSNRELSSKMSEINGYIDNYYINKYDKSAMADTAAAGYVSALGDPYSEYIDAEGYKEMLEDLTGDYTGIGVEIYLGSDGLMTVLSAFDKHLAGKGIAAWTKPNGGYFISLNVLPGCAKAVHALLKEAGVVMTGAGATYPYGKDPEDRNLRIAPTFPTEQELQTAADMLCLCVKLAACEKLLSK